MILTEEQKSSLRERLRESLVLYFDSSSPTGYLRFCPLSTPVFPHGLSIGVKVPAKLQEDVDDVKDKVADFLVEGLECLLNR